MEKRTKRQEERLTEEAEMIKDFTPILDLNEFSSLPNSEPTKYGLRRQLIWHRVVDRDTTLPAGLFTSPNKVKLKELVLGALKRRQNEAEKSVETDVAMVDSEFYIW